MTTITSLIQQAQLRRPPRVVAPCGHLHGTDRSAFTGTTTRLLIYLGRIRCHGSSTHVYARKG